MNKKVMALAVAGAFVMPAAAFAQASNVQIFGTMYMEYSYSHQGAKVPTAVLGASGGDLVNIDLLQAPGSEIGVKGEEALGGGNSVWFQCATTADIRGAGTGSGIQGLCGRNSAIGLMGSWGNAFVGNWDSPMKADIGAARIVSDTGIWGAGPMLFGNSSSFNDSASAFAWSRRQNNSISYTSPVFSGFQVKAMASTPSSAVGNTTLVSGGKPRLYSMSAKYSNGPLMLTAGYEQHTNFSPTAVASLAQTGGALTGGSGAAGIANTSFTGSDSAFQLGGTYQLGPVKVGLVYTNQTYDTGIQGAGAAAVGTDAKVSAFNLAGEWAIVGPHALRGGYTKANNTRGNFGQAGQFTAGQQVIVGNRVYNGGGGGTGGTIVQVQYVYAASKRTEMTAGYVRLQNDANARYSLGGLTAPQAGQNQDAVAMSIKTTF